MQAAFNGSRRMPEPSKPEKKPASSQNSTPNNSWLMYVVLTSLIIVGTISLVSSSLIQNIRYPDLIRLIENTKYKKSGSSEFDLDFAGTGMISLVSGNTTQEISKLRDVLVDDSTITGTVDIKYITDGKPSTSREGAKFQTTKDNSNDTTRQVREKLDRANIVWTYRPGPSLFSQSFWFLILPLLLVTGVLM